MDLPPLVALRHSDFRKLWMGQIISVAGTQMRVVAVAWQLYQLTHSALSLGCIGLTRLVPMLVFSMKSGVAADSVDRRKVMLAAQTVMMLCSAALALLTVSGRANPAAIYALLLVAATGATFDMPARHALVPRLVPREHLSNAVSLNMTAWELASVGGPALAGLAIAHWGVATAYALDAASFLAVIVALLLMEHRHDPAPRNPDVPTWHTAREGLRFVWHSPMIFSTMLLDFIATFFGSATTILPIFADQVLHVGARGLGLLYAASGAGALLVALYLALRGTIRRQGATLLVCVAIYGACMAAFGLSTWFPLSLLLLAGGGAADAVSAIIRGTLRQLLTPDELRGRMNAVNMLFIIGGPQLGEVEAGVAAHWLGPGPSVLYGGLGCLAAVALLARRVPALARYDH